MLETCTSHVCNCVFRGIDPVCCVVISIWLVPNVDDHISLLSYKNALDLFPITNSLSQACRAGVTGILNIPCRIMYFKNAHKLIEFTPADHISGVTGAIFLPALTAAQNNSNRIRALCLYILE